MNLGGANSNALNLTWGADGGGAAADSPALRFCAGAWRSTTGGGFGVAEFFDGEGGVEFLGAGELVLVGLEGLEVFFVQGEEALIALGGELAEAGAVGEAEGVEGLGRGSVCGGERGFVCEAFFLGAQGEGVVEIAGLGGDFEGAIERGGVLGVEVFEGFEVGGGDVPGDGGGVGLLELEDAGIGGLAEPRGGVGLGAGGEGADLDVGNPGLPGGDAPEAAGGEGGVGDLEDGLAIDEDLEVIAEGGELEIEGVAEGEGLRQGEGADALAFAMKGDIDDAFADAGLAGADVEEEIVVVGVFGVGGITAADAELGEGGALAEMKAGADGAVRAGLWDEDAGALAEVEEAIDELGLLFGVVLEVPLGGEEGLPAVGVLRLRVGGAAEGEEDEGEDESQRVFHWRMRMIWMKAAFTSGN